MLIINNKALKVGNKWLNPIASPEPLPPTPDPYNPLGLPANTVRVRTSDGNPPIKVQQETSYEIATLVQGTSDVYDVYKSGTDFITLLANSSNVVEVLGANATGITSTDSMFYKCTSLTSVPIFDTSNVIYMNHMFYNCSSLTSVPLFDTSNVTYMDATFYNCQALTSVPLLDTSKATYMDNTFNSCYNVQSGALALYQQASSQPIHRSHSRTFYQCGRDTISGAAELAQIPSDWK